EGPGSSEQAAFASSNARASIQPSRRTTRSRSREMWAGGPPKPVSPIRSHSLAIVPIGADGRFILRQHVKRERRAYSAAPGRLSVGGRGDNQLDDPAWGRDARIAWTCPR